MIRVARIRVTHIRVTHIRVVHYILLFSLLPFNLSALSIVYNLRIAQMTKQSILDKKNMSDYIFVSLLFDEYRKKYDTSSQNFGGGFGSFIYDFASYSFRTDFAVAHIKETNTNHMATFVGTETDDLLFTLGRSFMVNERSAITFSSLFGIPTHKISRLQHVDFGYGQIGIGGQCDAEQGLKSGDLLYAARYVYFVPRTTKDDTGKNYNFTLGNLVDLLLGYKNEWGPQGFECGYTARFQYGAHISPHRDNTVKQTNFIRNTVYVVYKHSFLIGGTHDRGTHDSGIHNRLLFNIACGTESAAKTYGNKYLITIWAAWNINL